MTGKILLIWTIQTSIGCLFGFLIIQQLQNRNRRDSVSVEALIRPTSQKPGELNWLAMLWLTGSVLSLVHVLLAFGFVHHWSHHAAMIATADQTEELLGFRYGAGVFFNYAFVALWITDAIWLLAKPAQYRQRRRWIGRAIYGYLLFIAINGAIVFATGWSRWTTAILLLVLTVTWMRNRLIPPIEQAKK